MGQTYPTSEPSADATVAELVRRIEKLAKINGALMARVERSVDQQANAYSLFQTAIGLESQVRMRTDELKSALTRLERTNDELVTARDEAERANRFKTRFFTAVGHDLLQPLHAARLSLSAMTEHEGDLQHNRLALQIDHALSSIEEMLKTILDLSKLETGVIKPTLQTVALADLFHSLAVDLEPIARNKGLVLSHRTANLLVKSDPLMLRRILQNLLANAVNYTEHGQVKIAARRRGEEVRIEVWDTGPGIAPAERARIFEEFQRGSASERARSGGFGLGLSITQRMAEALRHRIELCSKPGHGTRFSVFAPFAGTGVATTAAPQTASNRQAYGFAATKVFVIDNDAAVLEAMRTLLKRWSCEIRLGQDLSDLDILEMEEPSYKPDIVLADFHLDHGTSGLDAVERLRRRFAARLPAIIITADHAVRVADEVRGAGCELLRKPVRPAELRALMLHLLGY